MTKRPPLGHLDELPVTLTVAEAADLVGLGLSATYEAVRQGRIPAIRVSERRIVVPTIPLLQMLGIVAGELTHQETASSRVTEASDPWDQ